MLNLEAKNSKFYEQHPFHLVNPSPWPIFTSLSLYCLASSFVVYFHYYNWGYFFLIESLIFVSFILFRWFEDIIVEATYEGHHTFKVQQNVLSGMLLFITSEIMFFFAFFWAFFHFSLSPAVFIGMTWPPKLMQVLDAMALPLLNTVILLSSGVVVTWAHRAIVDDAREQTTQGIFFTVAYGILFTALQKFEYDNAHFSIDDCVYGSTFYLTTGFHGLHVLIGTLFLLVCLIRHLDYHFFKKHHVGFICAIWYWHFVDVVWIFLFLCVYIWGS